MKKKQDTIFIGDHGAVCSAGDTVAQIESTVFDASLAAHCISRRSELSQRYGIPLGSVDSELPEANEGLDNTRNNRLVLAAIEPLRQPLQSLIKRYGRSRVGAVVGTSTSGIATAEAAMSRHVQSQQQDLGYDYAVQELSAPMHFLAKQLGIDGPCWSVSTACTSGGKSFAMAARLLRSGLVDAMVVGGVDSLCRMTIEGFSSLNVVSDRRCLPFSLNRQGINIGEGAAFFILSREESPIVLSGFGETSDAHHISAPHPQGAGARAAMLQALESAQLSASDIAYINLHGTATKQNDLIESHAVSDILGADVACSSTKSVTGHTLAAAGALEALFCIFALKRNDRLVPTHLFDGMVDPELGILTKLGESPVGTITHTMSNSFAFGGNNLSLIVSRF